MTRSRWAKACAALLFLSTPGRADAQCTTILEHADVWEAETDGSLYVVAAESTLIVYDVSTPALPVRVADLPVSRARSVALHGTWAYAGTDSGIAVVDLSNPSMPSVVTTVTTGWPIDVAASDTRVAVLFPDRVTMIDATDPATAFVAGEVIVHTNIYGLGVRVAWDPSYPDWFYAAVLYPNYELGNSYESLAFYAIGTADPTMPTSTYVSGTHSLVGFLGLPGPNQTLRYQLTVAGSRVAVSWPADAILPATEPYASLNVYDVTSPTSWTSRGYLVGGYPASGHVQIGPNEVLWASNDTLHVVDVPPTGPIHVSDEVRAVLPGEIHEVGDRIFYGATDIALYDLAACGPTVTVAAPVRPDGTVTPLTLRPNPARGPVEIEWSQPRNADVVLEVMDVAGRLVARPWSGPLGPGEAHVSWDGRAASGRPVPAGVYFVRLRNEEGDALRKMVRLR